MGATDSERFDVLFRGECLDGADEATVRAALGRLFRADAKTLDRLFSGELQRIKRGVDYPTAEKYRTAMERAGARPLIQSDGHAPATAGTSTPDTRRDGTAGAKAGTKASAKEPASDTPGAGNNTSNDIGNSQGGFDKGGFDKGGFDNDGLDLAPVGSDVLRREERPRHDAPAPATDHLDLAPAGAILGAETVPGQARPAPDFDVAAIGADLLDQVPRSAAASPDTSQITLAAPDHDLSDCASPAPDSPAPAIDHLALAPPGDDLITADERHRPRASAPAPRADRFSLTEAPVRAPDDAQSGDGGTNNPFDHR